MKVGFIGLGVMGGPMAANVLKGGHELTVYDLNPAAVAQLTALGARAAASPRELGQASEVVITMLPEPQHVEGAILGENGAASGMAAGGTVIDMSTIDPTTSQRIGQALKARGISVLLIEQKLTIAMSISDRALVMGHGSIVFEGTPDALRQDVYIRKEWLEV